MRLPYRYIVLFVCALVQIGCMGFAVFSYGVFLPSIREDLGLTYGQAGILGTVMGAWFLVFSVISGMLASRYSPRLVIACFTAIAGAGMILTSITQSFEAIVVTMSLIGIGAAGATIPAIGIMASWFAPRRRGTAVGIQTGAAGVGILSVGLLVPAFISLYGLPGWRYAWGSLGASVLILAAVAYIFLRDRPAETSMASSNPTERSTLPGNTSVASRLPWGSVYKLGALWHLGLILAAFSFGRSIYQTFFVAYVESPEVGFSYTVAGGLWSMLGIISIISGIAWGYVSDRLGRKQALANLLFIFGSGIFVATVLRSMPGLTSSIVLVGLTLNGAAAVGFATSQGYVRPQLAPAAVGFMGLFSFLGQTAGPVVGGYFRDLSGTFIWPFWLAVVVVIIGILLAVRLPKA